MRNQREKRLSAQITVTTEPLNRVHDASRIFRFKVWGRRGTPEVLGCARYLHRLLCEEGVKVGQNILVLNIVAKAQ